MVFSTLNNSIGSFFGSIKSVAESAYSNTVGGNNQPQEIIPNDPNNDDENDLNNDGNDDQQSSFRPMMEASVSPTTINSMTQYAFPTCDICLYERNGIEPTNYYCQDCELALCREHVRKHYLENGKENHNIYDPRSNHIVNMELLKSLQGDEDSDDDIEIITMESLPISTDHDDDFEHHQIFQASDSALDVNNLIEEEEEIININNQDFIYWTRLLKTYPHFSTNIIHTPLIIRKLYLNGTLGGSLLVDNRTQHPINVILSQVGPLHQLLIPPNRLGIFEGIGRVHFTVEVGKISSNHKQLTSWDRALPIIGTVCTSVATGVGIAAGVLTGVGLIGGLGLAIGGGLSSATIATAPVVASVASVVNKDKKENNENQQEETSNETNDRSILGQESAIGNTANNEIFEELTIQEKGTEPSINTEPSSKMGEVSKWIKKLVPGKHTYPNSSMRGVFCDGHSVIIVTMNDEDVRNQNNEDGYFDLELKTF